jgi:adenylosuccinate synthase
MDATGKADDNDCVKVPDEGDLSICLNCGALYQLLEGVQTPMTDDDINQLPDELRSYLATIEDARRTIVKRDLQPMFRGRKA